MFNEEQIENNIKCKWEGELDAIQALWIKAGANGGKISQEEIEEYWKLRVEGMEHQEKLWGEENNKKGEK